MKHLIFVGAIALSSLTITALAAERHKWNNPENERRYKEALRQESEARRREGKAQNAYGQEIVKQRKRVQVVKRGADAAVNTLSKRTGATGRVVGESYKATTRTICRGKKCD